MDRRSFFATVFGGFFAALWKSPLWSGKENTAAWREEVFEGDQYWILRQPDGTIERVHHA